MSPGPWAGWEGQDGPGSGGRSSPWQAAEGGGMVLGGGTRRGSARSGCVHAASGRVVFGAAGRARASPWPWAGLWAGFGKRGPVVREEFCAIKIYLLPAPLTESDFDSGTVPKSISLSPSVSASAVPVTEVTAPRRRGRRGRRRTAPDSPPWFSCLSCSLARMPATPPPRSSCAPRP